MNFAKATFGNFFTNSEGISREDKLIQDEKIEEMRKQYQISHDNKLKNVMNTLWKTEMQQLYDDAPHISEEALKYYKDKFEKEGYLLYVHEEFKHNFDCTYRYRFGLVQNLNRSNLF